ncbi:MAG: outer membrane beta-barrel protein [Planctomycetes bacterium]|nr:outer membrane beta-barrel protein [Planctomycetota bacterium]
MATRSTVRARARRGHAFVREEDAPTAFQPRALEDGRDGRARRLPWSLGLAALLLTTLGCALPSNWERGSNYVGLGASYGIEHFDLDQAEEDSGFDLGARGAVGGEVRLGQRVTAQVELELQAQLYDAFEIDASDGSSSEVELRTLTLNAKLYENLSERWFPGLSERLCPYVVLGLGAMQAELDDSSSFLRAFDASAAVGRAGLGLEAFVSDAFVWFVEGSALEPFDDLDGLSFFALTTGVQWRF